MRGFIFFTECLVVLLLLFSCFCTDGQEINIECIPLEDCPLLLKQVSKNKYALETIEFLKLSHCGYSKDKKPLVWCPDVNSCMTPDGTMGTCTDLLTAHLYST
ncbi:hypothetical protein JTB14_007352 [Gonioctena quinquepunctata]|nr:hypothetical protein JTB14_007352 [Gonioctena quinquepunctata]